jgi:hypothetical protein
MSARLVEPYSVAPGMGTVPASDPVAAAGLRSVFGWSSYTIADVQFPEIISRPNVPLSISRGF